MALKKGDGKVASEKLEELEKKWQSMTIDEENHMIAALKKQLAEIKQDVLLRIAAIIGRHGAEIAFPTQTLHLPATEGRELVAEPGEDGTAV